jgi:hypothetical protein
MLLLGSNQTVGSCLRYMNAVRETGALHASSSIDSISKQLEATLLPSQDTCSCRSTIQPKSHSQIPGFGAKTKFQLPRNFGKASSAMICESNHDDCVIGSGLYKQANHYKR